MYVGASVLTPVEKIMFRSDFDIVKNLFIFRSRLKTERIKNAREWMEANGFELVSVSDTAFSTDDGREILRAHGKAWALKSEVHEKRTAEALVRFQHQKMAMERKHGTASSPHGAVCLALIDGQLCGGTLIRASVCPRCALGKQGVVATLTCDVCGRVTAIVQEATNG